jgi:hypothetical protein
MFEVQAVDAAVNVGNAVFAFTVNAAIQPYFENVMKTDNTFEFLLRGEIGTVYEVQSSLDLSNWTAWRTVTNATGATLIVDPSPTNSGARFYRAYLPP